MNRAPAYQREILAEPAEAPADHAVRRERRPAQAAAAKGGLFRSFRFAIDGIWHVAATQRNFRWQLAAAVCAAAAGFYWRISAGEWLAVLLASTLVLVLEMMNTAIEAVVDMVTRDYHPLAKSAKDIAAAAVLVAALGAVMVGVVVFGPHVMAALAHEPAGLALPRRHS